MLTRAAASAGVASAGGLGGRGAAPPSLAAALRLRLLGIADREVRVDRRGFACDDAARRTRLEAIGRAFLAGYHAALAAPAPDDAAFGTALEGAGAERRGFAYEGAAMAFALRDLVPPRTAHVAAFLRGAGGRHAYMVHVGVGWALARLRRPAAPARARLDPLLGWLAVDGYGFHEGYFRPRRYVAGRAEPPRRLAGYERRAFDQGLGRALWFAGGADARRVAAAVCEFPPMRRPDLWSGVGLACAYAGGADADDLALLGATAGAYRPTLAQGAAFAAKARARAGTPVPHTEVACAVLCGCPAAEAATATDVALAATAGDDETAWGAPRYERWRRAVQHAFRGGPRA